LLVLIFQQKSVGAELSEKGREIYAKQCAECHGKNGEGVKDQYDDALYGDWSLEKLTRYIDKNMPDDAPEKCVGPDAEAVARYIFDAFYSREARARNNPARVELVHLTNRQFVNTVADLLKHFGGEDGPIGTERGLRAAYFPKSNFSGSNKLERLDREIVFDFGEGHPEIEAVVSNSFSIKWNGSLIADESGDYEIILKTPNGARLYLNEQDEPLIDASIASGENAEHKASIRLIGGRAYPLRLEYFKSKEKTASIALWWKPPHGIAQPIPARNFSPNGKSPTFVVTTPFPPDDSSVGYERGVSVSKAWDEAVTHAAIATANHVAKNLDRFARTKPDDKNRAEKIKKFCQEFVATAFRRPLTEEQKRLYVALHFKKGLSAEESVKRVVLFTMKSPQFLYLGLDRFHPDDFEIASRLSFNLWDSLPNAELWKRAAKHELHTPEQVRGQARRMLKDVRARAKVQDFLRGWVQMNRSDDLSKDNSLYPGFTPEIIFDLRMSLDVFLENTFWNDASDYRQFLLADYMFLNDRLAKFYGFATNASEDFVKVKVNPTERSGVLTHPYLLASFSYQKSSSPIHRGVFLTRNIVGRSLKPPPIATAFNDADFDPHLTMREKVSQLTSSRSCQTCHSVINPLGFSLEHYDAIGRFRTKENKTPINAVSDYVTDDGKKIRFTGARDVAEFAIHNEHAQNAFIAQLFNQVVKQPMLAYGPDVMSRLRKSFVASNFNMQKLLVEIASVSALHGVEPQTASTK
jgi:hypothetical protein